MASAKLGKKVLAVLLAALMLTTSSATVFAEIAEDIGGGQAILSAQGYADGERHTDGRGDEVQDKGEKLSSLGALKLASA